MKTVVIGLKHGLKNFKNFKFFNSDSKISWKRFERGVAELDITINQERKWIEVTSLERFTTENGRVSEKTVYVTLDEEHGRALYQMMKEVYGE